MAVILLLVAGTVSQSIAKSRPPVQDTSLWVQGFMADGRLEEWGDTLRAFDAKANVEYSLGNDDMYLYLAVRSNQVAKILVGGVGLEVERADSSFVKVTFPYHPTIALMRSLGRNRAVVRPSGRWFSTINQAEQLEADGFAGLTDSIIFIANEYGVLASGDNIDLPTDMFPEGESFSVVELAIPLKYLLPEGFGNGEGEVPQLNYRIHLRGAPQSRGMGSIPTYSGPVELYGRGNQTRRQLQYERNKQLDMYEPSVLVGTYRLAPPPTLD